MPLKSREVRVGSWDPTPEPVTRKDAAVDRPALVEAMDAQPGKRGPFKNQSRKFQTDPLPSAALRAIRADTGRSSKAMFGGTIFGEARNEPIGSDAATHIFGTTDRSVCCPEPRATPQPPNATGSAARPSLPTTGTFFRGQEIAEAWEELARTQDIKGRVRRSPVDGRQRCVSANMRSL
jgi:hypothetical protein